MTTLAQKQNTVAWLARKFIGAIETRPNGGPMVEMFQRAVDGTASGEPWCVGFVWFCVQAVDDLAVLLNGGAQNSRLHRTEWTIDLFEKSPHQYDDPAIGRVVVWQNEVNENRGHCGIVVDFVGDSIVTIEANTSAASGDQRDGDGVWLKKRPGGKIPGFKRLGYLGPWE